MLAESLQLNDVLDGFRDERRLKLFFDSRVVGFKESSEPVSGFGDKRKSALEQ